MTIHINIKPADVSFEATQEAIKKYVNLCEELQKSHPDVVADIEVAIG